MWGWLLGRRDRRKDHRQRFERERDQRIQAELDAGLKERRDRERYLIEELRRLERVMQRDGR